MKKSDTATFEWKSPDDFCASFEEASNRIIGIDVLMQEALTSRPDDSYRVDRIPDEWLKVLGHLRANGAPEAMIAGGALRDLFNGRPIKDVDIFMSDRWSSKELILRSFKDAGLEVHAQKTNTGAHGDTLPDAVTKNTAKFNRASADAEAWTVIAGPDKTEYNIILLRGPLGKEIRLVGAWNTETGDYSAMKKVIEMFDIGLCQIACNGEHLYNTLAYKNDALDRKITLLRPNHSSKEHLERIVKKYSDFKLDRESEKLLGRAQKKTYTGYGYSFSSSGYGGFRGY